MRRAMRPPAAAVAGAAVVAAGHLSQELRRCSSPLAKGHLHLCQTMICECLNIVAPLRLVACIKSVSTVSMKVVSNASHTEQHHFQFLC